MYRIGICDDDETFCWQTEEHIRTYCDKYNLQAETQIFLSGKSLLECYNSEKPFDLLLLDIEMEELNGIAVGQKLRTDLANEITQIVYISSNNSYAMQLFKIRPMDFLIKPVTETDIEQMMNTYCQLFVQNTNYFEYKNGKNICRINQKHILYFQSEGRVIHMYTINGTEMFYGKLSNVLNELNPRTFCCVHKSFVINWNYVAEYRLDKIILSNGVVIPISQSKRSSVREQILLNNMKKK